MYLLSASEPSSACIGSRRCGSGVLTIAGSARSTATGGAAASARCMASWSVAVLNKPLLSPEGASAWGVTRRSESDSLTRRRSRSDDRAHAVARDDDHLDPGVLVVDALGEDDGHLGIVGGHRADLVQRLVVAPAG